VTGGRAARVPAVEFDDAVPPQKRQQDCRTPKFLVGAYGAGTTCWRCFTLQTVRVSVFSRTAIHAPGGWALIENLPHVFTGDRVTVGNSSAYLLPQRQNDWFLLHGRLLVLVARQCLPAAGGCAPTGTWDKRCVAFGGVTG